MGQFDTNTEEVADFFSKLLNPITLNVFIESYVEKQPFHNTSVKEIDFSWFISLEKIARLAASSPIRRREFMRIWSDQQTERNISHIQHKFKNLAEHFFLQNGSITLNHLQNLDDSCSKLAGYFASAFNSNCVINSYLTPKGSQTFSCHWDDHDVFILQIEGEKTWSLYEPQLHLPLTGEDQICKQKPKLLKEVLLSPGSLLYLPRGYPHEARSSDHTHSLHLTVGCYPLRGHDVAKEMLANILERCRNDIDFRCAVNDEKTKDKLKEILNVKLVDYLKSELKETEFILKKFELKTAPMSPSANEQIWNSLSKLLNFENIDSIKVDNGKWFIKLHKEQISLYFRDEKISFPFHYGSVLEGIKVKDQWKLDEFEAFGLEKAEIKQFVITLITAGFFTPNS